MVRIELQKVTKRYGRLRVFRDIVAEVRSGQVLVLAGRNGSGVFVTPEGPALALTERRRATLDGLAAALDAALAAGHDAALLRAEIEQRLGSAHGKDGGTRRRAS